MTSHFTGTTKTEDGVMESSVWRGASSDDCEKQAARVQTWRAGADRCKYVRQRPKYTVITQDCEWQRTCFLDTAADCCCCCCWDDDDDEDGWVTVADLLTPPVPPARRLSDFFPPPPLDTSFFCTPHTHIHTYIHTYIHIHSHCYTSVLSQVPWGLRGCKNRPAPFPGRMS